MAKSIELSEIERDRLCRQLERLSEMMDGEDYGSREWKQYNRDYGKIARLLFPEAYKNNTKMFTPGKRIKTSQKFANTFNKCKCGSIAIRLKRTQFGLWQAICDKCEKSTDFSKEKVKVRDFWNKLNPKKMEKEQDPTLFDEGLYRKETHPVEKTNIFYDLASKVQDETPAEKESENNQSN